MNFFFVLSFSLFLKYNTAQECYTNPAQVEYYEELIKKNILESLSYKSPTSADEFRPKSNKVTDFGQFDFIVIGAGASGAVIANRLSEIKKWKVLLLEAGGDIDEFGMIPGMMSYLLTSKYNWNFTTTPQTGCCFGRPERRCAVNSGKALGGTTSIGAVHYARSSDAYFNIWARDGITGWSFKDVLPYFIKSENCQVDGDPNYHGKGGYLNVRGTFGITPQLTKMIEATQTLFNYTSTDYNGKCQLGLFIKQANMIRGERQSTARAFLTPFEKRKNLLILRYAYATKILIENKVARGVEFSHNGTLFHATTKKEVILSAGGIQSPQLLMLSGIGPKDDLKKLNISLIKNSPVGFNTPELPSYTGLSIVTNYTAPVQTLKGLVEEYFQHEGELTICNNEYGIGFFQSSYMNISGTPDIRLSVGQSSSLRGVLENITNQSTSAVDPRTSFSVSVQLLSPLSLGNIKLKSKDPYTYPLINPNYFNNTQDLEVMYEGVQLVKSLVESPEMKSLNASLYYQNNSPECAKYEETTKDFWFCNFRYSMSAIIFHGMGACRMGCNSNAAVVNNKLQVHGVKKLRVADGSIIPTTISAVGATVVMIGEKVSDDIKRYYNERVEPITNVFGYNN